MRFSSPRPENVEPPTADHRRIFRKASNKFGFALYKKASAGQSGNFALGPASITFAFDIVLAGAREETASELTRAMGIRGDVDEMHEAAGRVLMHFNDPARQAYELHIVNRLFGEATFRFEEEFLTITRSTYRAPFEALDFMGSPDEQRGRINAWVAEQTEQHITDLLPQGAVTEGTRLVVANAVYFLGAWLEQFDTQLTADGPFTRADGSSVDAPLMRRVGWLRHGAFEGMKAVDLPYRGNELVMTLLIPDSANEIFAVEERLTADAFTRWTRLMSPGEACLVMPRFKLAARLMLSENLKALGIDQAFDSAAADFRGIAPFTPWGERLYISEAYHQAFVTVDETGTEAAAATAVPMETLGPPPPPVEIHADSPFLFVIREPLSGIILFLGRVVDPTVTP